MVPCARGCSMDEMKLLERHNKALKKKLAEVEKAHRKATRDLVRAERELRRLEYDMGLAQSAAKMDGIRQELRYRR